MVTLATAVVIWAPGRLDRREEIAAADLFAVELTHDHAELIRFLDEHVTSRCPMGGLARAATCLERRWSQLHPPAPTRLAAMRRYLAGRPGN